MRRWGGQVEPRRPGLLLCDDLGLVRRRRRGARWGGRRGRGQRNADVFARYSPNLGAFCGEGGASRCWLTAGAPGREAPRTRAEPPAGAVTTSLPDARQPNGRKRATVGTKAHLLRTRSTTGPAAAPVRELLRRPGAEEQAIHSNH